jgi:catechol 2,3-dioxygenase-like lactoylglutathione lyase family enzyme
MESAGGWLAGRIPTSTIDHVAFNVPNLEEALGFFTTALGCSVSNRGGPVDRGGDTTLSYALVFYDPTMTFELLEWRGPNVNTEMPRFNDTGGGHLAFRVVDFERAMAVVREQPGIQVDGPELLPDGRPFIRFTTPWGMTIQLIS